MEFHHVGISVRDMDRSIRFYTEILDMTLLSQPFPLSGPELEAVLNLKDVTVQTTMVQKGSLVLELFDFASPEPVAKDPEYSVADRGITHFGFTVSDIDAMYDRLQKHGVRIHAPVTKFEGGVRATYARDPVGNVFEMLEMPAQAQA